MCGSRSRRCRAARTLPGQQAQAGLALVLVGGLEQELHAQAQPEHGHAGAGAVGEQPRPGPAARKRRIASGNAPTPGTTIPSGARISVVVGGEHRGRPDVLERLLDAAAVAHAVVDDRDHVSVPFVDGIPVSVGSTATAARSARANAL